MVCDLRWYANFVEEYETSLYAVGCKELEEIIDGEKLPIGCKVAIQNKEDKPAQ